MYRYIGSGLFNADNLLLPNNLSGFERHRVWVRRFVKGGNLFSYRNRLCYKHAWCECQKDGEPQGVQRFFHVSTVLG